jgi:hypothetical protein
MLYPSIHRQNRTGLEYTRRLPLMPGRMEARLPRSAPNLATVDRTLTPPRRTCGECPSIGAVSKVSSHSGVLAGKNGMPDPSVDVVPELVHPRVVEPVAHSA